MLGHATGNKYFVTTYILTIYDYDSDFLILKLATTFINMQVTVNQLNYHQWRSTTLFAFTDQNLKTYSLVKMLLDLL